MGQEISRCGILKKHGFFQNRTWELNLGGEEDKNNSYSNPN
jgi:hypothetical protein